MTWGPRKLCKNRLRVGRLGQVKQYGRANELLIDIDEFGERALTVALRRINDVLRCCFLRASSVRIEHSHSGRWHIVVTLTKKVSNLTRAALRAICGSDYKRETFNLARLLSGVKSKRHDFLFSEKLK